MIKRCKIGNLDISICIDRNIIEKGLSSFLLHRIDRQKETTHKDETCTHVRHAKVSIHLEKDWNIKIPSRAILVASFNLKMFNHPGISRNIFKPKIYQYRDIQYIIFPGLATMKLNSGLSEAIIVFSSASAVNMLLDIAFEHLLFNLLEEHNLFVLHAAGVAKNGEAVLFPAAAGSGKSTLAAALTVSGFNLISDDVVVFSAARKTCFSIFPALEGLRINLDSNSLALLSLLKKHEHFNIKPVEELASAYKTKQPFLLDSAFLQHRSRLKALVFPTITHKAGSYIRKLTPKQAAQRLLFCGDLPNFCHAQSRRAAKFENIFDMVSNTESYQFFLGRDIDNWNDITRSLFKKGECITV